MKPATPSSLRIATFDAALASILGNHPLFLADSSTLTDGSISSRNSDRHSIHARSQGGRSDHRVRRLFRSKARFPLSRGRLPQAAGTRLQSGGNSPLSWGARPRVGGRLPCGGGDVPPLWGQAPLRRGNTPPGRGKRPPRHFGPPLSSPEGAPALPDNPPTHKHTMKYNNSPAWLPTVELEFVQWTENFVTRLSATASIYGILPPEVSSLGARHTAHKILLTQSESLAARAKNLTATRRQLVDGEETGSIILPEHPGSEELTLNPGLRKQIIRLAALIKKSAAYTPAAGKDLGIEASPKTPIDWSKERPELKSEILGGVLVRIHWKKGTAEGIRLEVNRGAGWGPLSDDLRSPYDDSTPLPGTPAVWRYRGTYLYKDQLVGHLSLELSVPVHGN